MRHDQIHSFFVRRTNGRTLGNIAGSDAVSHLKVKYLLLWIHISVVPSPSRTSSGYSGISQCSAPAVRCVPHKAVPLCCCQQLIIRHYSQCRCR
jgi:hypothetical protein